MEEGCKMEYTVDLLIFGIANKDSDNIRELSRKNLSVIWRIC